MTALLADLDDTFFDAIPSPANTPVKNTTRHDATRAKNACLDASVCLGGENTNASAPKRASEKVGNVLRGARKASVDARDVDLDALCDGAEDWDWKDMDVDIDGEIRPIASQQSSLGCPYAPPPPLVRERCTRCEVLQVTTPDIHEKVPTQSSCCRSRITSLPRAASPGHSGRIQWDREKGDYTQRRLDVYRCSCWYVSLKSYKPRHTILLTDISPKATVSTHSVNSHHPPRPTTPFQLPLQL